MLPISKLYYATSSSSFFSSFSSSVFNTLLIVFALVILTVFGDVEQQHQQHDSSFWLNGGANNETKVLGVCSRPNIPPNGRIRFASPEKVKFAENETIYVLCEENQFPHHIQKRVCRHGEWFGAPARCGKSVTANVVKLKAFHCNDLHDSILSLDLNQTDETPYPLPPNSFHFTRVHKDTILSVFGSSCYRWIVKFERKIEIAFLLIDINLTKMTGVKMPPKISVDITHRLCTLQHTSHQVIEHDEVFGFYFFCDLKQNFLNETDTEKYTTDYLVLDIHTTANRTVGLEAVFVGQTYKKLVTHKKMLATDCGKLEIQKTGVLEQVELGYTQVNCNDTFRDASGKIKHKFICDANGQWQGEWPKCLPKRTCPKSEIILDLDPSVIIEQIGNVYYTNQTEWHAIDYSWVRYACANFESIMVGKNDRLCRNGRWTNKKPHCTDAIQTSSVTITIIAFILAALVAVFSLIVYFSIKFHTKKINRTLQTTKNEIEATALSKQLSADYYTDIGLETIYEDCKEVYSTPLYEMSDDVDVRYDVEPTSVNEPEYLTMTEGMMKSGAGGGVINRSNNNNNPNVDQYRQYIEY